MLGESLIPKRSFKGKLARSAIWLWVVCEVQEQGCFSTRLHLLTPVSVSKDESSCNEGDYPSSRCHLRELARNLTHKEERLTTEPQLTGLSQSHFCAGSLTGTQPGAPIHTVLRAFTLRAEPNSHHGDLVVCEVHSTICTWPKVGQLLLYSKVYWNKHSSNGTEERNKQSKAKHSLPHVHQVLPCEHQPLGAAPGESAVATSYI